MESIRRGVVAVVETHSSLLLREIQTLVATAQLAPEEVRLHWLRRGKDGMTAISTAALDDLGAWGDWPEDFDTTDREAEKAYLDAVEMKEWHKKSEQPERS
jgi:predicted ATPase